MRHDRVMRCICRGVMLAILSILLIAAACTFSEPQAPVWSIWLAVPLISDTITMEELAEDTEFLDLENNNIIFSFKSDLDDFEIGDMLKLDGAGFSYQLAIPASVPAGLFNQKDTTITMPGDIVVTQGIIKSGQLEITYTNGGNSQFTATLSVPDLEDNGVPFDKNIPILPGSSTITYDLADYVFSPGSDVIDVSINVIVDVSGSVGGNLDLDVSIDDLVFSRITGTMDHLAIDVPTSATELDIPEEYRNFELGSASLKMIIKANFDVSQIEVDMSIEAVDVDHPPAPAPLSVQGTLTDGLTGDGMLIDTLSVAGLEQIINAMPNIIEFEGSVEVGDGGSVTISDTSTFQVEAIFTAPLSVKLPEDSTEMDPAELDLDDGTKDLIAENIERIELVMAVESHIPFGAGVALYFSNNSTTLYTNPMLIVGPLAIISGVVDPVTGFVTASATDTSYITLDEDDLDVFQEDVLFQGMKLFFPGTDDVIVTAQADDYITILAYLKSRVRMDFNDDE